MNKIDLKTIFQQYDLTDRQKQLLRWIRSNCNCSDHEVARAAEIALKGLDRSDFLAATDLIEATESRRQARSLERADLMDDIDAWLSGALDAELANSGM